MHGISASRTSPSLQTAFRAGLSPTGSAPRRSLAARPCTAPHSLTARPRGSRRTLAAPPRAQGDEDAQGNGLFTPQFMGVLQQSLARQGADALTKGIEASDEARTSAVEEVLTTALNQSKQTLRILQQWRNQIDAQIAAQEKQVSRMEFALNKARNDAALMKTLKEMVYEQSD